MKPIDLRSDTVTLPTRAMRDVMANAELGDDVYGEDPSVNRLQEHAAALMGKEAAVFVASGTLANQASIRSHTHHGDVVLAGEGAHILRYESGAPAALSGVQVKTLGEGGFFDARDVALGVHPKDAHYAPTTLVALENTHNFAGGRVFPLEPIQAIAEAARDRGLALHLDGARIMNAVVASGISASVWAAPFDTVAFCLSKGLGAPVGSLVAGSTEQIERIRRIRKMWGGGMRQAGVLAAAGLYALEHHVDRLAEDHLHARSFAEGLETLDVDVERTPETNMVMFRFDDTQGFVRETRLRDLLINPTGPGRFRVVTHLGVRSEDVDDALGRIREALEELRG